MTELEDFWQSLWDYFGIVSSVPPTEVLSTRTMPGGTWFSGARLNYAEHIVGGRFPDDAVAVVARSQTRPPSTLTFGELTSLVGRTRAGLQRLGVGPGDRVVGYLPNIPETLAAFLACASLGATWATCAPEFGERSVVDRFAQIEPTVFLAVGGYRYGDTYVDRRRHVANIVAALPSVTHVVDVAYGTDAIDGSSLGPALVGWDELTASGGPLEFEQVPFDHPLCVLFSSGTTGLPKAIVHGQGAILLEHLKNHALSWDLGPGDRLMWFSTTAWMMWNALVSTLLTGASIVMLDGNPLHPDATEQWRLAAEVEATVLGVSPAYLAACRKSGVRPGAVSGLRLRELCTAGAPLPPDAAAWIYDELGDDLLLMNGSGGTDVCTGIVQGNPLLPVWAGAISGRCLGVATAAYDLDGRPVVGELGELVITEPMPSMPVGFWNDPDGNALSGDVLRPLSRRLATGRLGAVLRERQLCRDRSVRRHAQPRWRAPRDRRVLPSCRRVRRSAEQPRRAPRGSRWRTRRADSLRGPRRSIVGRRHPVRRHRSPSALRVVAASRSR